MTNIQFLKNRIIIDGHADTKEQCETISLLCDNLAKSKDFNTVRYEKGYAEFVKVGQTVDLKFAAAAADVVAYFDSNVSKVDITQKDETDVLFSTTTSGENLGSLNPSSLTFRVTTTSGYIIDNVTLTGNTEATITNIMDNSFDYSGPGSDSSTVTITITTKQTGSSTTKQQIELSTLSGWANLSNGEHSITVKVKASGYTDSAASNAVSVEKAASGHTVNFSNDLGESPSTTGKLEYTLDGTTWNTVLEWSNWDGNEQPLQVTSLSNVTTIKFRLTMSEGEPSTLTLTGTVVGSTTKIFEIEANFSTTTVSTDMLTLTSAINVSITNGDSAP